MLLLGPAAAQDVVPRLTWVPGELTFRDGGTPRLVLGRNPAARNTTGWIEQFDAMAAAGEVLARIHLCWMPPDEVPGEVSPAMLRGWDALLDAAEARSLAVLPVFGVWSAWNDGSGGEAWHGWDQNPYNAARGGPARAPAELLSPGRCRELWLRRVQSLVRRWAGRRCVVGWEIFSELDLITGATEPRAAEFAAAAAAAIREADPLRRPLTASLTNAREWPVLWRGPAVDWVQVHPYGHGDRADLDEILLRVVRQRLTAFGKPVLLGECGLDWAPPRGTLDASPQGAVGLRHAVWAALVSGAANARMFWWQDGYDAFEQADLTRHYQRLAAPAARFAAAVDWTRLRPLDLAVSPELWGAALADPARTRLVAWYRDRRCRAPQWPTEPTADAWLELPVAGDWQLTWVAPEDGRVVAEQHQRYPATATRLNLPTFRGSLALRASRSE